MVVNKMTKIEWLALVDTCVFIGASIITEGSLEPISMLYKKIDPQLLGLQASDKGIYLHQYHRDFWYKNIDKNGESM